MHFKKTLGQIGSTIGKALGIIGLFYFSILLLPLFIIERMALIGDKDEREE